MSQPLSTTPTAGPVQGLMIQLASSLTVMGAVMVAPILPKLGAEFGASSPQAAEMVPLVATGPALAIALFAPIAGILADRFGRKAMLLIGTLLYGILGCLPAFLHDLNSILLVRLLFGCSEAILMTCCTTLIADYWSGEERSKYVNRQVVTIGIVGSIFFVIGGAAGESSWRTPFYLYLLPAAASTLPDEAVVGAGPARRDRIRNQRLLQRRDLDYGRGLLSHGLHGHGRRFRCAGHGAWNPGRARRHLNRDDWALHRDRPARHPGRIDRVAGNAKPHRHRRHECLDDGADRPSGLLLLTRATSFQAVLVAVVIHGLGVGYLVPNLMLPLLMKLPARFRARGVGGFTSCLYLGQFASPLIIIGIAQSFGGMPIGLGAAINAWAAVMLVVAAAWVVVRLTGGAKRHAPTH